MGTTTVIGINNAAVSQQPLQTSVVIAQDGDTYTTQYLAYDAFNNPTSINGLNEWNPQTQGDTRGYLNDTARWVLGRLQTRAINGTTVQSYGYNSLDQVITKASFGLTTETDGYDSSGNLATKTDGNQHTTQYLSYYRGTPQTIEYPDSTSDVFSVNGNGTVASITDGRGNTTSYSYDALGRLASIIYTTTTTTRPIIAIRVSAHPTTQSRRRSQFCSARQQTYSEIHLEMSYPSPSLVRTTEALYRQGAAPFLLHRELAGIGACDSRFHRNVILIC